MKDKPRLSKSMTLTQFTNGYWYATEIKEFADTIGIPYAGKLRKDELEKAIIHFLKTGKIQTPTKRSLSKTGIKDVEKGLSLKLPIVNYTNDKETKDFIEEEAARIAPKFKRRSGARYRLNRWREEQITSGNKITYGDLINQYIKLNQPEEQYARVPVGRYINFLSDFLKAEKHGTKEDAIRAWHQLKKLDIPKDYRSWAQYRSSKDS